MKTTINTKSVRADVGNGYAYVRNLKGDGVIDALIPEHKEVQVYNCIENNKHLGFSKIWEALINIKGIRFSYKQN